MPRRFAITCGCSSLNSNSAVRRRHEERVRELFWRPLRLLIMKGGDGLPGPAPGVLHPFHVRRLYEGSDATPVFPGRYFRSRKFLALTRTGTRSRRAHDDGATAATDGGTEEAGERLGQNCPG